MEYLCFDWQDAKESMEADEVEMGGCWGVNCGISGAARSPSLESPLGKSLLVSLGMAILQSEVNDWLVMALKDCCDG